MIKCTILLCFAKQFDALIDPRCQNYDLKMSGDTIVGQKLISGHDSGRRPKIECQLYCNCRRLTAYF